MELLIGGIGGIVGAVIIVFAIPPVVCFCDKYNIFSPVGRLWDWWCDKW